MNEHRVNSASRGVAPSFEQKSENGDISHRRYDHKYGVGDDRDHVTLIEAHVPFEDRSIFGSIAQRRQWAFWRGHRRAAAVAPGQPATDEGMYLENLAKKAINIEVRFLFLLQSLKFIKLFFRFFVQK